MKKLLVLMSAVMLLCGVMGVMANSQDVISGVDDHIQIDTLSSLEFNSLAYASDVEVIGSDIVINTLNSDTATNFVYVSVTLEGTNSDFFNSLLEFKESTEAEGEFDKIIDFQPLIIPEKDSVTINTRLKGSTVGFEAGSKSGTIVYTLSGEAPETTEA